MQRLSLEPPRESPSDEAQLLERCRLGDSLAWEEVFERHYPAVGRFIFQLSPGFSLEDVEEVCQETFLSAIRKLGSFRGGSSLQTWLFRIAANKGRDYRERQMAAKRGGGRASVSLDAEDPEHGSAPPIPSSDPQPDAALERTEQMQMLERCLELVGDPCREVIELRYFGDLSYEEISRTLGLNVKTVSSRLSKCLDRLGRLAQD
ncbi:MAG TPA: RNA polymerase sigma factor, partial [Verrucomicrobiota bacterium]|nr:RNA polymerase sigma factor [Verrucomicrobiota bacterium]